MQSKQSWTGMNHTKPQCKACLSRPVDVLDVTFFKEKTGGREGSLQSSKVVPGQSQLSCELKAGHENRLYRDYHTILLIVGAGMQ